jgi:hypothetical protein
MLAHSALHTTELVHETRIPLLARERYDLSLDAALVEEARAELLGRGCAARAAEGGFRSGFLLGVEADPEAQPACVELAMTLHSHLLAGLERSSGLEFRLSFFKLGVGPPPTVDEGPLYEGPHLDSHPGLTESTELLRLLVNLSEHPRRFLYCPIDRWQLAALGVACGRREFVPLVLPPETVTRVIELPGHFEGSFHALKFLASAVAHVGLNDPPEHFLVSFEALSCEGIR